MGGRGLALEQRIVGSQHAGLIFQHHRNAIADWKRQAVRATHQHQFLALLLKRSLAHRAGQNVEQSSFHLEGLLSRAKASARAVIVPAEPRPDRA